MVLQEWQVFKTEQISSATINASANRVINVSGKAEATHGGARGLILTKNDVANATLTVIVNGQTYVFDESNVVMELLPDQDITSPFTSFLIDNADSANATAVQGVIKWYRKN